MCILQAHVRSCCTVFAIRNCLNELVTFVSFFSFFFYGTPRKFFANGWGVGKTDLLTNRSIHKKGFLRGRGLVDGSPGH